MKAGLQLCLFVASVMIWVSNGHAQPAGSTVTGEILEVIDVKSYTYLRLKTKDGETWAAVSSAQIKKGDKATIINPYEMRDFTSNSLNRTFPIIFFGELSSDTVAKLPDIPAHSGVSLPSTTKIDDAPVAKASGANARTVEEIITQRAKLKDKPVLVRGRVVKFNSGIMGKNWVHLRDGTGSIADKTNDILVTTENETAVGNIVTVKGIIRTEKNFGSGYLYEVLVEDATLN